MKKLFVVSSLILSLCGISIAQAAPNPGKCPDVNSIKNGGLMTAEPDPEDNLYVAGQISNYGMPVSWAFAIAIPMSGASSAQDALNKARNALPSLSGNPSPMAYNDQWVCIYNDLPNGYHAIAITPVSLTALTHSSVFKVK